MNNNRLTTGSNSKYIIICTYHVTSLLHRYRYQVEIACGPCTNNSQTYSKQYYFDDEYKFK